MLTIVYASRAARAMTEDDLAAILHTARERNADAVTGMLLYAQATFLQQLEGEDAAVDETFARIQADDRHTDLRVLARRPIEARRFPGWSMGFEHPDAPGLRDRLAGYTPPGAAPLVSFDLVFDAEVAETLLGLYALRG